MKVYSLIKRDHGKSDDETTLAEISEKKILKGDAKNRIFHSPECDYYYSQDCSVEFKDSNVALKTGFEPCMFCRTILAEKQTEER